MNTFDLGTAADADLLVFADWLEDVGNPDTPAVVRQMVEELRTLDRYLGDQRRAAHCRPGVLRLLARPQATACYLVATRFVPEPGFSAVGGWYAPDITVPTPACGTLANSSDRHRWFVVDVLMRRYRLGKWEAVDDDGTVEITDLEIYTDSEIRQFVADYAEHRGVAADAVLVERNYDAGRRVIGFRLSLDGDGHSHGCDEIFGIW